MPSPAPFLILTGQDLAGLAGAPASHFTVDNNCACPDFGLSRAAPPAVEQGGSLLVKPELHTEPLGADTFVVFNPRGAAGPVVLNQAALELLERFTRPQLLSCQGEPAAVAAALRRLAELELLEQVAPARAQPISQPETLVAWLHTTNACNLRCTYCYVEKSDEAMSAATGHAALEAIFRAAELHGYPRVKLKYAGGEATLNFGLVMELHKRALALAQERSIALAEVVLSNGVLLPRPLLDFIRSSGMTLMISLDGLDDVHAGQRRFRNGRGSARHVLRSIDRALDHGIAPHLSITVTSHNAQHLCDVVRFALDRNLLFNLNFYRDNAAALTGEQLRAEDERLIAGLKVAFNVIEQRLPQHSLLASLVDRANFAASHETACGAGHSYLVVDQRGNVARCQMEIEQRVTDVFAPDPLTEIRLYDGGFQNISVDAKEGCSTCSWRYWCAGGCPALTYRVTGRTDVKSPYCRVYRAIYPDLLRLEGRRLLHYSGLLL